MLAKTPKSAVPIDLETVKRDLAEAEANLTTINESEPAALSSASAYDEFRAKRDAVVTEIDRLTGLRDRTLPLPPRRRAGATGRSGKRVSDQRSANEKLARGSGPRVVLRSRRCLVLSKTLRQPRPSTRS